MHLTAEGRKTTGSVWIFQRVHLKKEERNTRKVSKKAFGSTRTLPREKADVHRNGPE